MSETQAIPENHDESGHYEIRLKGHLNDRWSDRLGDVVIILEDDGTSLIISPVIDQAALHGLLKRVRDLGLPLISVNFVNPGQVKTQEDES
jgi:hypothetical protein